VSRVLVRDQELVWRDEPAAKEAILAALGRGEDAAERGWVILVDRGQMHELNLLGGEIWCLADGTRDREAVARDLAARYDAPYEEILIDVADFVAACTARGWLREKDA